MKQSSKKKLFVIGAYALFITSLTATFCGTFAWYTYGLRVPVRYDGTSIGDTGSVEIGFVLDHKLSDSEVARWSLEPDYAGGKDIYWCEGGCDATLLSYLLNSEGYASTYMNAVTAGRYAGDGISEFRLREPPSHLSTYRGGGSKYTDKKSYQKLNLCFRCKESEDAEEYKTDFNVYLNSASVVSDGSDICKGIRMYIDTGSGGYLVDPNNASANPKTINAGGALNLNSSTDEYYDYYRETFDSSYEFPYGEFLSDDDIVYETEKCPEDTQEFIPFESTFNAHTKKNCYKIDMNKSNIPQIKFGGMANFYNKNIAVCKADKTRKSYAYTSITIYLEGWDRNVDNQNVLKDFSIDLSFEAA